MGDPRGKSLVQNLVGYPWGTFVEETSQEDQSRIPLGEILMGDLQGGPLWEIIQVDHGESLSVDPYGRYMAKSFKV